MIHHLRKVKESVLRLCDVNVIENFSGYRICTIKKRPRIKLKNMLMLDFGTYKGFRCINLKLVDSEEKLVNIKQLVNIEQLPG